MSLSSALNTALYGLGFNQRQLDITAANIASADTAGYTRKSVTASVYYGNQGQVIGVVADQVHRSLDEQVQSQYRTSQADMEYINLMSSYASRVDELLGSIQDPGSLSEVMTQFVGSLADLTASPDDYTVRLTVLQNAKAVASELNSATESLQRMRQQAETGINDSVNRINQLVNDVADIDREIVSQKSGGFSATDLLDQRDRYLDELSGLVDMNIREAENGSVRLYTTNGMMLLDVYPAEMVFDKRATLSAEAQWSADPNERLVGTVTLLSPGGSQIDMIANNGIQSGQLGAYIEMRDEYLVSAQNQLDEIASQMSLALSDYTVAGVDSGAVLPQVGSDLDLSSLKSGNAATLNFTDIGSGQSQTINFVRVDDATKLPLADDTTAIPNDQVFGIDFSAGTAAAVVQMQAALDSVAPAPGFTVSDQGGGVIRVLDDSGTTTTLTGFSARVSASSLTDESVALPFFTDNGNGPEPYTGALEVRDQKIGFAGRISVNLDLVADVSRFVIYETGPDTLNGDPLRPEAMLAALTTSNFQFHSNAGVGTASAPFEGSVLDYLTEVVGHQGAMSAALETSRAGQEVVSNNLRDRVDASSEVSIDEELARLIELENAYTANARVMSIVQELFDVLMRT